MDHSNGRRSFLEKASLLAMTTLPTFGLAKESFNTNKQHYPNNPDDNANNYLRLIGSLTPRTLYSWFSGHLWGIVPGEAPKALTTLQGLAKSNWDVDGELLTKQSFDLGFFGDLENGELLQTWTNPYTNEKVKPFPFMYGGGPKTSYGPNGKLQGDKVEAYPNTWVRSGNQVWLDEYGSFQFKNPLQPEEWPHSSAGEELLFGSSTTYSANADELFDKEATTCGNTFFWTAINSWEPWMRMGQRPGFVMWRATGRKIFDVAEIPDAIKAYVAKVQPNYFEDKRPWKGRRSTYSSYMEARGPETKE